MIFIGDIACPYNKVDEFVSAVRKVDLFKDEIIILNLEANILTKAETKRPLTLYNAPSVLDGFSDARKVIVSLANNHMYDYPNKIMSTKEFLERRGIGVFGLLESDGSIKPYEYDDHGQAIAFFGHCWRLYTNSNCNNENDIRISDDYYDCFAKTVIRYKKEHLDTQVYCFMHWNYDLEKYVMPMHVKLSRHLIDNGVEAVVGSHSHRPQGAELYKGKTIAYGLGNFYLPSGQYFDGNLTYPVCSQETYGLRLNGGNVSVIWFDTDRKDVVVSVKAEEPIECEKLKMLSQFATMTDDEYRSFFKQNRSKKVLVPLFDDFKGNSYKRKEFLALARVNIIRTILRLFNK